MNFKIIEGFVPLNPMETSRVIGYFGEGFTIKGLGAFEERCRIDEALLNSFINEINKHYSLDNIYRKVYVFKGKYTSRNFLLYLDKGWGAITNWDGLIKTNQRPLIIQNNGS